MQTQTLPNSILLTLNLLGLPQDCDGFDVRVSPSGGGITHSGTFIRHPTRETLEEWFEDRGQQWATPPVRTTISVRTRHTLDLHRPNTLPHFAKIHLSFETIDPQEFEGHGATKMEALANAIIKACQ